MRAAFGRPAVMEAGRFGSQTAAILCLRCLALGWMIRVYVYKAPSVARVSSCGWEIATVEDRSSAARRGMTMDVSTAIIMAY